MPSINISFEIGALPRPVCKIIPVPFITGLKLLRLILLNNIWNVPSIWDLGSSINNSFLKSVRIFLSVLLMWDFANAAGRDDELNNLIFHQLKE